jgi:RNA polymerase sigma-70 factor (ECF subfamily)
MIQPVPNRAGAVPDSGDLLVRHREGDESAFPELVGVYQERLVHFFYRLCFDRDRAEDLTQELFLKLLRNANRYEPQGRLSTFVFRVATNLWIDHYRSERPSRRLWSLEQVRHGEEPSALAQAPAPTEEPIASAMADEEKQLLRNALQNLTEPHRLVFELAVYQQLPYAEVGAILEIPVGTVKSRMFNTVAALRQMLGAHTESSAPRAESAG